MVRIAVLTMSPASIGLTKLGLSYLSNRGKKRGSPDDVGAWIRQPIDNADACEIDGIA